MLSAYVIVARLTVQRQMFSGIPYIVVNLSRLGVGVVAFATYRVSCWMIDGSEFMCSQAPPNAYGDILVKKNLDHEP